jgi:hypothetical protein
VNDNLNNLKLAVTALNEYFHRKSLKFNSQKCKIVKFRNGGKGRYRLDDVFRMNGENLQFVPEFCYLGVTFQSSGSSFARHIEKRSRAALMATYNLKELRSLSIETATKLFNLKISPIASYAIEVIWSYLTLTDLENLERVKTRYYKRVLGLSKYNKSRYTYKLVGPETKLFVTDLKVKFNLPDTEVYKKFCLTKAGNVKKVSEEFYQTETMRNGNWRRALFPDRHVFTRYACHGYHYVYCKKKAKHFEPENDCCCKFCDQPCEKYHITKCSVKTLSLRQAAAVKM